MIAMLLLLVALNVPIALAIGFPALVVLLITGVPQEIVPLTVYNATLIFPLLAIPLFMFAGSAMEKAEIADALVDFTSALVGWLKGGLGMVNVVVSMFFAGMSGATTADVASIGSILIPQMKRKGYPTDFTVAVTSFSATASLIIPPSISMIIYGVLAQVSVVKLFIAGIVPGLILGFGQMIMCFLFAKKYNYPVHEPFELKKLGRTSIKAAPAGLIPLIILGGILGGIFTVTESAAFAVVVAVFLGLTIYPNLTLPKVMDSLVITGRRTSVVLLLIATSGLFGWFLANEQIPQQMAQTMLEFTTNPYLVLALLNVFLALIGCFISGAASLIILTPILVPIVSALGVDPLHFGVVMVLNLDMGTQTPPVGNTMLLACVIGNATIGEVFRVNKYFILLGYGVVFLITYVPDLCLFLPSYMK